MKVLKNGVEVYKVMDVVRKEGNYFTRFADDFFNRANREANQKRDIGLKGSRDDVQLRRRRRKKMEKSSRQKNRNGKKR